ncbi:MAG: DUF3794 domain-containing protein [Christensenellaceae bacterium]|jgi:hypothetical protein|nr:DUF3794 domain-containing protein [Christensenellaceae bacterium]
MSQTGEGFKVCTKKRVGSNQIKVSATSDTQEKEIAKVLGVNAQPHVVSTEVLNAEAKADMSVSFMALVCFADGSFGSVKGQSNIRCSIENAMLRPGQTASFLTQAVDITAAVSHSELIFGAVLNSEVYMIDADISVKSIVVDDDIYTKESDIEINSYKQTVTHKGNISFEEPKDSKFKALLFANHQVYLKNTVPNNDYLSVTGGVVVSAVYECEDGVLKSFIKNVDFSEEIEAVGLCREHIIQTRTVASGSANVNNVDGEGGGVLYFEVPYALTADIYDQSRRECIVDAYSVDKEVNLTTSSFEQTQVFAGKSAEESVVASFSVPEDKPRIEKILSVTGGGINITNALTKNGEVVTEGIAGINIVYFSEDDDGNNVLNAMTVDVPFSALLSVPEAQEGDNVQAQVVMGEITLKNRKGRELEVIADIKVNYNLDRQVLSAVATDISFGDAKSERNFALEIFVARENQTIWDIAKHLNISTEELLEQNAELTLPIAVGDKVVCYHKRKTDF